jgi:hypothetical protein
LINPRNKNNKNKNKMRGFGQCGIVGVGVYVKLSKDREERNARVVNLV